MVTHRMLPLLLCLLILGVPETNAPLRAQPDVMQQRENLRAFAKLYGYVRFFHPSDASAELDWNSFAVHGAARVLAAGDRSELRGALNELFAPVAPSLQLYGAEETPQPFTLPAAADTLPIVAWQHLGVDLGGEGGVYRSVRSNRNSRIAAQAAPFGNVLRAVDAAPYRGRRIRMRASVRVPEGDGRGQLWLRVDRAGGARGFFDNMGKRPITSDAWAEYEITGTVAEDADQIYFGCFLLGKGTLLVDAFEMYTAGEDGEWMPMVVENPGFEEHVNGIPGGWALRGKGYQFDLDPSDVRQGLFALRISRGDARFTGTLFPTLPSAGEVLQKDLGGGLRCQLPVALYVDAQGQTAYGAGEGLAQLNDILRQIRRDSADATEAALRCADVIVAWNVFQHFYPYFDLIETDWDAALDSALIRALMVTSPEEHVVTLRRMVAGLHDGHGSVRVPPTGERGGIPAALEWIEGTLVVTAASDDCPLHPGDVIHTLDEKDATSILEKEIALSSGSPQWKRWRAVYAFGIGAPGSEAVLTVRRDGALREITVTRVKNWYSAARDTRKMKMLDDGIFYVNLSNTPMRAIRARIGEIAAARGVVFDLRGYPEGNHDVIRHLLSSPDTSAGWMRIPRIVYPDHERVAGEEFRGWEMQPAEPHIRGHVVFITDGRAISYAESFMGLVEHYRLGDIVGQPTAGANGNVNPFTLPGGTTISWTGMHTVKHDGSQHHLVGIQPTHPATRTLQGVREGRDELLERAIALIKR